MIFISEMLKSTTQLLLRTPSSLASKVVPMKTPLSQEEEVVVAEEIVIVAAEAVGIAQIEDKSAVAAEAKLCM